MLVHLDMAARAVRWYSVADLHNDNTNCMATHPLHQTVKTPRSCMEIYIPEASRDHSAGSHTDPSKDSATTVGHY